MVQSLGFLGPADLSVSLSFWLDSAPGAAQRLLGGREDDQAERFTEKGTFSFYLL